NRAQAKRATGGAFRPPMSVIRRSGSKMDDGSPTLQGGVGRRLIEGPVRSADPRRGRPIRRVTLGAPRSRLVVLASVRPARSKSGDVTLRRSPRGSRLTSEGSRDNALRV